MLIGGRRLDALVALALISALSVLALGVAGLARAGATDAPAPTPDLVRGQHVATVLAGCTDCHGASNGGGRAFVRDGVTVVASNLTGGAGGIGAFTDSDVRRAIRRGIGPDGRGLQVMPWREYAVMTDADVAAVIAYLRSLPPVDNVVIPTHTLPAPSAMLAPDVAPAPALEAGAYLATVGGCTSCHGANLAGVERFGLRTPNISRTGIGNWSFTDFQTTLRTGVTPAGHQLSAVMPWRRAGEMTDAELRSLYDFLEADHAPVTGPANA